MILSVHITKAPPDDLGRAYFCVNMCGGYVDSLGMVHDCKWIAAINNLNAKKSRAISAPAQKCILIFIIILLVIPLTSFSVQLSAAVVLQVF